jgi:hypothetical protein
VVSPAAGAGVAVVVAVFPAGVWILIAVKRNCSAWKNPAPPAAPVPSPRDEGVKRSPNSVRLV